MPLCIFGFFKCTGGDKRSATVSIQEKGAHLKIYIPVVFVLHPKSFWPVFIFVPNMLVDHLQDTQYIIIVIIMMVMRTTSLCLLLISACAYLVVNLLEYLFAPCVA